MFKQIPNILTIIRFLLIPIILFYIFTGNYLIAFVIFTISGITDIADGFIARKYNLVSNFGKLMDPLADKLTQISVLFSLTIVKIIPVWIVVIVIIKEIIMVSGASFLYGKDVVVYSRWYGKLATVLFYIAIVFSLLEKQLSLSGTLGFIDLILYCLALITTIFALIMYIYTLHNKGFINKDDLNKNVTVDKK
ncbi:MAG: CDP-diacylglycerol--glycerol-3-phosphate 3-phosphatidyltransferase [Clostridia bacterium]|nr:CDP-diacylglycerol--glycerol-3-phosphate 3-phosphatidyltransferase [Clostridia bacterium]